MESQLLDEITDHEGDICKYELPSGEEKKSTTPTLDMFSRDISKMASANKLDPIIGRGIEIQRLAQILSRRKKNNPVFSRLSMILIFIYQIFYPVEHTL